METMQLPDGRLINLGGRTSGGSKNQTRFATLSDGDEVVVKVQATHGRLRQEEMALAYARHIGLGVPRMIAGWQPIGGGYCLVISREPGIRTHGPDGWFRMGRDLAALASAPVAGSPITSFPADAFIVDHLRRLGAIGPLINGRQPEIRTAIEDLAGGPPVLTHGDPGSGNYLDHESGGTILDWETASISPFGIDIGRAAFIALLDNDHTGAGEELRAAVVEGYREGLHIAGPLDDGIVVAGTIVAGLQFIHGRQTRPLRSDRTAQQAAEVLINFLDGLPTGS